jgi:hypothetical protein
MATGTHSRGACRARASARNPGGCTMTDEAKRAHEQLLERMAHAVLRHCEHVDVSLITEVMLAHPGRMTTMLSARGGERFSDAEFARFALQCAKRIKAGGPT